MSEIDQRAFRNAMGNFCTGIVIVTGMDGDAPVGFAAQSFVSLSLDPPLVAVCPGNTSSSWPKIRASGSYCINILSENQKPICDVMATSGGDKFAELDWTRAATGSPVLAGTLGYVDCDIEAEHPAGDHTIAVGRVREFVINPVADEVGALLFFRGQYGEFNALG